MITKYGYDVFFTILILSVIIALLSIIFIKEPIIRYPIITILFLLNAFSLYFFRDPERHTATQANSIIAPADGKIIKIDEVLESEFIKGRAIRICIFMSPLNVHVNRSPITGTVGYYRYAEGEYFAAFEDKASEKNEQTIIGIEGEKGKILFKQIAGFIARRIVCALKVGDKAIAGERFGMIKFGSRVDVYVPIDAKVLAPIGLNTVAGETILAEF